MKNYLVRHAKGFSPGYTAITQIGEAEHDTGINFGILKLRAKEQYPIHATFMETACLLIQGECLLSHDDIRLQAKRQSCFDEAPWVLHLAAHQHGMITALADCELAVLQAENFQPFPTHIFTPDNLLENEHRGKGLLNDTAYRLVRTIFDLRNRPESKLVLGEVLTAPGRWSSYPPHHHEQPEIYHYRFTEPQGYGHAECGDELFKVQQFDTYKILNENDHAQTAAPGYGMYYLWVIRHLENKPYQKPVFTPAHYWTSLPEANQKVWKGNF